MAVAVCVQYNARRCGPGKTFIVVGATGGSDGLHAIIIIILDVTSERRGTSPPPPRRALRSTVIIFNFDSPWMAQGRWFMDSGFGLVGRPF